MIDFWEADPSYDEARTLCDPGWQSQPTIDHNLYTKYLETERLTLTKQLPYHNTRVHNTPLFMAIKSLTLLIYHALI